MPEQCPPLGAQQFPVPKHHLPDCAKDPSRERLIAAQVPAYVSETLPKMPEFVKAYEPGGTAPCGFISYGVVQRTLCQFVEPGWKFLAELR